MTKAGSELSDQLGRSKGQNGMETETITELQHRLVISYGAAKEIQDLMREVVAWRERFPNFYFRKVDDCIERREP